MPFCRSCGIGEFQSKHDQTSCEKCPENMTSERGSISADSCYEKFEKSCDDSICGVRGKCLANGAFYTCECQDGFYGQNCELRQSQCTITPCFNGGVCREFNETTVECECPPGFNGNFCEFAFDPCSQKHCQNGANCNEIDGEATCECLPSYEGELCDKKILLDFCESSPCADGATCVSNADDYQCLCAAGFIGKRCHLSPCDYQPCEGNAICVISNQSKATRKSYK